MKRELLAYSFLIVLAIWVAYHLLVISIHGSATIGELNKWVAIGELVFTIGILVLGIERWLNWIKECRNGYHKRATRHQN